VLLEAELSLSSSRVLDERVREMREREEREPSSVREFAGVEEEVVSSLLSRVAEERLGALSGVEANLSLEVSPSTTSSLSIDDDELGCVALSALVEPVATRSGGSSTVMSAVAGSSSVSTDRFAKSSLCGTCAPLPSARG
jgi:hypothetical protein